MGTHETPQLLDRDVLGLIAARSDSPTRRTLRQVDRSFKASVHVQPSYGRRNAAFLLEFIKKGLTDAVVVLRTERYTPHHTNCIGRHARTVATLEVETRLDAYGDRQVLFWLHRSGEMSNVIGRFRYADGDQLEDLTIARIVQKRRRKLVSDVLNGASSLITNRDHIDVVRDWRSHVFDRNRLLDAADPVPWRSGY